MDFPWIVPAEQPIPAGLQAILLGAALLLGCGLVADAVIVHGLLRRRWSWRKRCHRLRTRTWGGRDAVLLMSALMAAYTLFAWVNAPGTADESLPYGIPPPQRLLFNTLLFHGVSGGTILCMLRLRRISWRQAFGPQTGGVRQALRNALLGVWFYVAAMPPVVLLTVLYRLGLDALGIPIGPQDVVQLFIAPDSPVWLRVYLAILAIAMAPLVEEMCFRGIALPILARRGGIPLAVVAASLLFAAVHLHIPSIAALFGIAAAFSLGYLFTGSLITPIVMHALFNTASLAALFALRSLP